jgi:hypothetical protein
MDEGRNMILLFPSLIRLETDEAKEKFKPKYVFLFIQNLFLLLSSLGDVGEKRLGWAAFRL